MESVVRSTHCLALPGKSVFRLICEIDFSNIYNILSWVIEMSRSRILNWIQTYSYAWSWVREWMFHVPYNRTDRCFYINMINNQNTQPFACVCITYLCFQPVINIWTELLNLECKHGKNTGLLRARLQYVYLILSVNVLTDGRELFIRSI